MVPKALAHMAFRESLKKKKKNGIFSSTFFLQKYEISKSLIFLQEWNGQIVAELLKLFFFFFAELGITSEVFNAGRQMTHEVIFEIFSFSI